MSANNSSNRRRNVSSRRTEAAQNGTSSNGQVNGRSLRGAASKKSYFVESESSDSDEAAFDVKVVSSPSKGKRSGRTTTTNGTGSKLDDESIAKLQSITGLSRTEANELLEACGNDIQKAVDIHFSSDTSKKSVPSASNGTSSRKAVGTKTKSATKRHHEEIAEESEAISVEDIDESYKTNSNSNSNFGDDNVRAPIPPKVEKLLDYDPYGKFISQNRSIFLT